MAIDELKESILREFAIRDLREGNPSLDWAREPLPRTVMEVDAASQCVSSVIVYNTVTNWLADSEKHTLEPDMPGYQRIANYAEKQRIEFQEATGVEMPYPLSAEQLAFLSGKDVALTWASSQPSDERGPISNVEIWPDVDEAELDDPVDEAISEPRDTLSEFEEQVNQLAKV